MNKQNNLNLDIEKELEKKYAARNKKKKPGMKVSGSSVRNLQKIIKAKNK